MQLLLPELVLGGVHVLPKWACLIALPLSVMAWDLPGECVPTMWRQPGTWRGTGRVSKLHAPHRRLEQHTVIFTRSEKLLITYCFKMLSITCQAYLIGKFALLLILYNWEYFLRNTEINKTSYLLKLLCNIAAIVIRDLSRYFSKNNQMILKFIRRKECARGSWML